MTAHPLATHRVTSRAKIAELTGLATHLVSRRSMSITFAIAAVIPALLTARVLVSGGSRLTITEDRIEVGEDTREAEATGAYAGPLFTPRSPSRSRTQARCWQDDSNGVSVCGSEPQAAKTTNREFECSVGSTAESAPSNTVRASFAGNVCATAP